MKKEEIIKKLILLGMLALIPTIYFCYESTTSNIDNQYYQQYRHYGTMRYYPDNNMEYYTNETLELLPPEYLLEFYNISVKERLIGDMIKHEENGNSSYETYNR